MARETLTDSTTEMEHLRDTYVGQCCLMLPELESAHHDALPLPHRYAEQFGLSDLKLVWTERRGYHLTLPVAQRETVERAGFVKIASQAKKTVACSTDQLVQARLIAADERP